MNAQMPSTAAALGLGEKFQYWHGASGRRYLFTAIPVDSVDEYRKAVVVLAHKGRRQAQKIVWIGEIDGRGNRHGHKLVRRSGQPNHAYIHLLAGGREERDAVIADLEAVLVDHKAA